MQCVAVCCSVMQCVGTNCDSQESRWASAYNLKIRIIGAVKMRLAHDRNRAERTKPLHLARATTVYAKIRLVVIQGPKLHESFISIHFQSIFYCIDTN